MVKKYHVFTITEKDIDDAIKQAYKQLKDQSDNTQEFKQNKKLFNETRRAIKAHPKRHHKEIMEKVNKELEQIEYKLHGRFYDVVQSYMISNHHKDAGMDM